MLANVGTRRDAIRVYAQLGPTENVPLTLWLFWRAFSRHVFVFLLLSFICVLKEEGLSAFYTAFSYSPQVAGLYVDLLLSWNDGATDVTRAEVRDALDQTVEPVVDQFADRIGLWND